MSNKRNESILCKIEKQFHELTQKPEEYLKVQEEKYDNFTQLLQHMYKVTILSDDVSRNAPEVLQELEIDDMDEEQLWQQLDLRDIMVIPHLIEQTSYLLALPEEKFEISLKEEEEESEGTLDAQEFEENQNDSLDHQMEDDKEKKSNKLKQGKKEKKNCRSTIVDDDFFKLSEMKAFLEDEDAKEMRKQSGHPSAKDISEFDFFGADFEDEDDEDKLNYEDFFNDEELPALPKEHYESENDSDEQSLNNSDSEPENDDNSDSISKNLKFSKHSSDSDAEEFKEKSSFEQRQERLQQRIRDYESEVLGEKPWQLKGEIQATSRPQNSLLEEILEFESTVRPAPVITEETTRCLEDIIRQRIKDQAWDDVEAKVRSVPTLHEYRKKLILDQEKSKESLSKIYEKEYQNEVNKRGLKSNDNEVKEEPKEHKEIQKQMNDIFLKLDMLFSLSFTPRAVPAEAKIITNTPAIAIEEVAPVAVSDANLLAPKEIFNGPRHELLGKSERNRTDKNRERRQKKQKQRSIHKAIEASDICRQKLGIPLSKKQENAKLLKTITKHRNVEKTTASTDKGSLKSSKAFFTKLQDTKATKRTVDTKSMSAKKLKL